MWAAGFGYSDLENHVPAKADSAYRLASVTKSMTAIGVLKLVEQGKIDLDAEVQTYTPYYPKKESPITVRQVLGHLGGDPELDQLLLGIDADPAEQAFDLQCNRLEAQLLAQS